jgi:hypothetical protein
VPCASGADSETHAESSGSFKGIQHHWLGELYEG